MQTRRPGWVILATPIVLLIACVAVGVYGWQRFGGSMPLQARPYEVRMHVDDASNLPVRADVQIAGVRIGRVAGVRRVGARAVVEMWIDTKYAPLRRHAGATLRVKSLLGEGYVAVTPGPRDAPAIPDGGWLEDKRVSSGQKLADVLSLFQPGTRRRVQALFTGFGRALRNRDVDINEAIAHAAPMVGSFQTVAAELNVQRRSLQDLVSRSGEVFDTLGQRTGAVQSAVREGNRLLAITGRRDRELGALVEALPGFLTQLRDTTTGLGEASGDLQSAASALASATPALKPALSTIRTSAPTYRKTFRQLPNVLRAGKRGLPAAEKILLAATPTLRQVYPALRQVIPIAQLVDADVTSVIGSTANFGQATNIYTTVGPNGAGAHGAAAGLSIWNEIVGGWVDRLPTNRLNPYAPPHSANDITRGSLKAYDCRNTGNRLYLPPIGEAPPCLESAPWKFNGEVRKFPHLVEDPP